ncbi:MAG: threonine--tRNA ligase, partial [SAR202 cluster bacterium]|nr:threonine--tRNA ligase [SAR202 cluster bacterium]
MNDEKLSELRYRIRHSAAHVMADVVTSMYPDAKLAIGPPTDDGFYYDFLVDNPFTDEDLTRIEGQMKKIIGKNLPFQYAEYSREEILKMNVDEPLKLEVIAEIPEEETIST